MKDVIYKAAVDALEKGVRKINKKALKKEQ